ncbi:hypothetical protein [Helicobacter sp. T3_23-1056]
MTKQHCHIEVSQETEISLLHCGFRDISRSRAQYDKSSVIASGFVKIRAAIQNKKLPNNAFL